MHRLSAVATTVLLLVSLPGLAAISDRAVEDAARAVDARVVEWRRDLHQNPELGNREFRTSQKVAEHLKSLASR